MINLQLNNKESKNLSEDEIEVAMARKLEVLLLPILRRNIEFFYAGGNLQRKANAYGRQLEGEKIEEAIRGKKQKSIATVCKPLCEKVSEILRENGLDAQTVSCDTDIFKHTDVLLTTRNKKQYIINYLEDIERIQTGMKTPDFASIAYYERRYKKFEGDLTTDGKNINHISFLSEEQLDKIDANLGYKRDDMYMDTVIEQIRREFLNFKEIMAENEWLTREIEMEKNGKVSLDEKMKEKTAIYSKYANLSADEELEKKMDWLFEFFNDRMDITGFTDMVMYHSKLLLKKVLTNEEYESITRYECFTYRDKLTDDSKITEIVDKDNLEETRKLRFCMVQVGEHFYAFSTKPNAYKKLTEEEIKELEKYAYLKKVERPSDFILKICDRGNALPLVFHPLGSHMLNSRAEMIEQSLSEEEKEQAIRQISSNN